jgi:sigma-B regulation protein RsbU (phosphoserine phosphatase)
LFEQASYAAGRTVLDVGDLLVMYSDGVTEAENGDGHPLDEAGLQRVIDHARWASARELGWAIFEAVEHHTEQRRLLDDLTVLVARRLPPLPVATVAESAPIGV